MAPKKNLESVLFHQKKKPVKAQPTPTNGSPRKPRPPPPKTTQAPSDNGLDLPSGSFTEFKLYSSALNGWKYDVMKFDSRKPIDILTWQAPIKLNRKDLHRGEDASATGPPVKPMLGLDGKPVIGPDGKTVMVDAEGRIAAADGAATKDKGAGKKKFQKKTRQVFLVPEHLKQLRKEERYPWIMEDSSGQEVWQAQLDDTTKAETQCFFMPAANDVFKFVPAHRWYKFQKKLKHDLPTDTVTVESAYQKHQKRDPTVWLHQRTGRGPSEQTAAMFKAEAEGTSVDFGNSLVHTSGESLGPGGRRLKTVDNGMNNLFGDDEDGDRQRKEKEYGGEGDMEEQVYEEEFADDDEKMQVDNDDEEAKELEERLKKEYKAANKTREGYIDDSDDEDTPQVTKEQRRMQKLIRNREGNDAYESDDDDSKNPYASSEESSDEEEVIPPMTQPSTQNSEASNPSQPQSQPPATQPTEPPASDVRATSPSLGGHSLLAQRATSPKPKPSKVRPSSPGNSPLASRATSPVPHSRATSPVGGSRAASPVNGKKRKADSETNGATQNGSQPKKKKKSTLNVSPGVELEDRMLVEWLRNTPNASTRQCIHHFTPYLTNDAKKANFTALVKKVASLQEGVLILRPQYRAGSSAPSPAS
ncbi:hypothetical protein CPB85DRAFT_1218805 [Mucidula mucida]|nr:hypothetical protein CPB85DRAFT_1218805 [Mucidula mucida]